MVTERSISTDMTYPTPPNDGETNKIVKQRLAQAGILPNENLGQHFLINDAAIGILTSSVTPGNTVIEVGAGVGQLTDALSENASRVVAVEIDRRYEPVLDEVVRNHPNVEIIYGDALALRWSDYFPERNDGSSTQIISSLPYHITEPFLHIIMDLHMESATLVVGQRLAGSIQAQSEGHPDFGQLSLLAQTFFDIEIVEQLDKQSFFPIPRTDSAIIRLTPKEETEFRTDIRGFLLKRLFLTARRSPLVKNAIKEGLIDFSQMSRAGTLSKRELHKRLRGYSRSRLRQVVTEYNRYGEIEESTDSNGNSPVLLTQSEARAIIGSMEIPQDILDKPFEQLNNNGLRALSRALRGIKKF